MTGPVPFDHEELLAHTAWMRALARRLVADPNLADDLVQDACVVALERPPRSRAHPRGWLAAVLRNRVREVRRGESGRRRRERAAARPEAVELDVLERAATHRMLVDAVLGLEEPFRTALLLRYFEDLGPAAIAARLGIPLDTARSRLRRGLERLRARLDREHGGREAWALILGPFAGGGRSGAAAAAGTAAGALAMNVKLKLAALATLAALAVLAVSRRATAPEPSPAQAAESAPAHLAAGDAAPAPEPFATRPAEPRTAVAVEAPAPAADATASIEPLGYEPDAIYGVVQDREGAPIAGARVLVFRGVPDPGEPVAPVADLVTDEHGRFRARELERFADHHVHVEADGFAPLPRQAFRLPTSQPRPGRELTVTLDRAGHIAGRVLDAATGEGLAGCRVEVEQWLWHGDRFRGSRSTTAGPDGRYCLGGVPLLRRIDVRASLPGRSPVMIQFDIGDGRREDADLALPGGAILAGEVYDLATGAPVDGAEIVFRSWMHMPPPTCVTGANGAFELTVRTLEQTVGFLVERDGYCTTVATPDPNLFHGAAPLRVPMLRHGSIEGVVLDAGGAPVAGARVELRGGSPVAPEERLAELLPDRESFALSMAFERETTTGPDGRFRYPRVGPSREPFELLARRGGIDTGRLAGIVLDRSGQSLDVELRLDRRSAELAGRVTLDGAGVEALVRVQGADEPRGTPFHRGYTDGEGYYHVGGLPAGTLKVTAGLPGIFGQGEESRTVRAEAGESLQLDLDLGGAAAAITGTVRFASGEPAFGAVVQARSNYRGDFDARVGADGSYRLVVAAAPGERFTVSAKDAGVSAAVEDVEVPSRGVDLVLPSTAQVRVAVLDADTGRPVAHVLYVEDPDTGRLLDAGPPVGSIPDDDGFVTRALPVGSPRIAVWPADEEHAGLERVVSVNRGSNAPLRLELERGTRVELELDPPLDRDGRTWQPELHVVAGERPGEYDGYGVRRLRRAEDGTWFATGIAPGPHRLVDQHGMRRFDPPRIEVAGESEERFVVKWSYVDR